MLRWHDRDQICPPRSIAAALEDPGLSVDLTDRILDRVIEDVLYWQDIGVNIGRVAINQSAGDFRAGDFADRILKRLTRAGLPTSIMELKVTETVLVSQHVKNVEGILSTLAQAGVAVTLDDFGTGYASLTHLKQFSVDTIKIDRSLISRSWNVETEDNPIVRAAIGLVKTLGIGTVAEGIETAGQAAQLAKQECDIGQGFLFGRPMPAAKVAEVLDSWDTTAGRAVIAAGAP